ncbi:glutathione S-transferase family protein [Thalassotalea fusca]
MGLLVNGKWHDKWYDTKASKGKFERQASKFRHTISTEADNPYQPEVGRYHLYVSLACPWAHRTLIFRVLKGLEDIISVSVVRAEMLENGWEFGETGDPLYDLDYLYQLYAKSDATYNGRVTVPVLWDKQTQTIVSNESAEIIRIFNNAFNEITGNSNDYYPKALANDINDVNDKVYNLINNGIYKTGFATTQEAYEQAFNALFDGLDWVESILAKQRYLLGDTLTEADWRLFTTLIRFDAVYYGHFKCNRRTLNSYPNISHYVRELFQVDRVSDTVDLAYTKRHYYGSHKTINPTLIVPLGPELDFSLPHDRDTKFKIN